MPQSISPPEEIVSDTGPIITLERLPGGFALLRRLYRRILIPPQVLNELTAGLYISGDYLQHYQVDNFIVVVAAPPPSPELARLDDGEQHAIALALERRLPLLIEDRMARQVAEEQGLVTSGIAGQILAAHRRGMLTTAETEQYLSHLYQAGRINQRLMKALMEAL